MSSLLEQPQVRNKEISLRALSSCERRLFPGRRNSASAGGSPLLRKVLQKSHEFRFVLVIPARFDDTITYLFKPIPLLLTFVGSL